MADASPSSRFDLCESCQAGDSERVKVLLSEKSADPNEANDSGMTPLLYATEGDHVCCIAVLLADPRIDPSRTGGAGGVSALMLAADVKAARAMGLLLADPRTDVNQGDERSFAACRGPPLVLVPRPPARPSRCAPWTPTTPRVRATAPAAETTWMSYRG